MHSLFSLLITIIIPSSFTWKEFGRSWSRNLLTVLQVHACLLGRRTCLEIPVSLVFDSEHLFDPSIGSCCVFSCPGSLIHSCPLLPDCSFIRRLWASFLTCSCSHFHFTLLLPPSQLLHYILDDDLLISTSRLPWIPHHHHCLVLLRDMLTTGDTKTEMRRKQQSAGFTRIYHSFFFSSINFVSTRTLYGFRDGMWVWETSKHHHLNMRSVKRKRHPR